MNMSNPKPPSQVGRQKPKKNQTKTKTSTMKIAPTTPAIETPTEPTTPNATPKSFILLSSPSPQKFPTSFTPPKKKNPFPTSPSPPWALSEAEYWSHGTNATPFVYKYPRFDFEF
ncbi:hypothetical protein K505DRAFT_132622 [Melanomma pulvis-pyrius CBS 109.77]|uniref:Uncharacterized protein n=1 Tax=Melanomma pulvis-pyrius CBS 109.77 TaxID=1314802 RepID=A0A6A6XP89_9PLEO|nr:hypothetical protein K505DRAFT_132622 [Melanomma pulvis-pyrius CBS 109.77]